MKILALDPGTKCGVAFGRAGAVPFLDTWKLTGNAGGEVGPLLAEFERLLIDVIDEGKPDLITYEAPFLGAKLAANMHTARRVIGFPCLIELVAHKAGIEVSECNLMTVRKHFVGKGRVEKRETIAECIRRGVNPKDDHAADAFACFWWAVACRDESKLTHYDPLVVAARRAEAHT